ncbi:hypothetical protein J4Q44_G00061100 [Coregonus suidteri]|uniref:Uncharacterized protein n=1 Tax=Coregonus suidteri TaxID=861788 RepID=A0AAN8MD91_9TELE
MKDHKAASLQDAAYHEQKALFSPSSDFGAVSNGFTHSPESPGEQCSPLKESQQSHMLRYFDYISNVHIHYYLYVCLSRCLLYR